MFESDLFASGHRTIPVSFNATLYRDAEGTVQGVFAIARAKEGQRRTRNHG
jgi:hypothetical protein